MTSEVPEEELAEQAVHDEPDPEEYEAEERETAVSDETGTVYDVEGETETTPHDEEIVEAEPE
ncbi:hypothetical protein [Nocardioides panaciterrulae]|uniref:Uncharacterized protein n=1 Tax=Nocardioides panaciterrulae TaxID=661492 RepID=A0A7Y9E8X4_9ACTN|nr:hypothetical protein [Nocardioides panaciterrulae]NYD43293.1 hypothetical protein [Nocardioides panaciterrulae]